MCFSKILSPEKFGPRFATKGSSQGKSQGIS